MTREGQGYPCLRHDMIMMICPKVNVIARLEFELANFDPAVHRFNHYTTRTPTVSRLLKDDQECHMQWGQDIIKYFQIEPDLLHRVITGDETWIQNRC